MHTLSSIDICVDRDTLRLSSSSAITGEIFVKIDDIPFPETGWSDFVVIILGWWLRSVRKLQLNDVVDVEATLDFMDGPFYVALLKKDYETVTIIGMERKTTTNELFHTECRLKDLTLCILDRAKEVYNQCLIHGWKTKDCDTLLSEIIQTQQGQG